MVFHIVTLFPEAFDSYLKESIIGRAIRDKKIKIKFYNPRDFTKAKSKSGWYKQVDDRPYAGGPGMVMMAEPLLKAVEKALTACGLARVLGSPSPRKAGLGQTTRKTTSRQSQVKIIIFSPSGKKFDTAYAKKASKKYTDIIMICGRYEGIDARVKKILKAEDVSIGDYVLTGGELPAMVLVDSISRQIPGVLHKYESLEEERVSTSEVYTRPEILKYKGKVYRVPRVLLSGDHKKIEEWKKKHK